MENFSRTYQQKKNQWNCILIEVFGYFVKRNTLFGSEALESIIHALPQCQKL
jgi:hypothetical protein